jgi:hypothetical protein
MNRQHVRYFVTALVATFVAAIAVGGLVVSLSPAAAGAAFIAGWWANLATAGTVAMLGARRVARVYTDPRLGRVAGTAMGVWTGFGSALGLLAYAYFVTRVYQADTKMGLAVAFMIVTFVISIIAGSITGRETAHPPEEEEV